jgi:hypothetical protein
MSERGSFVTQYIYCGKCLEAVKEVLCGNDKYFKTQQLDSWIAGEKLPIIAGKAGGLYSGEELHSFEFEYAPQLESKICHPLRIAVLADDGQAIFQINPANQEGS